MNIMLALRGCIEVERTVAELYTTFARMFPSDEAFWAELAADELKHIEIFRLGDAFEVFDELSGGALPDENLAVSALDYLQKLGERIDVNPLTPEDALRKALRIEELQVELFVNDMIEAARDRFPKLRLGEIASEERTHIEKIMQYMISKGITHYA